MRTIYIYGASGHGKVVFEAARAAQYKVMGFIDDAQREIFSYKSIEPALAQKDLPVALAIGDNGARRAVFERLKQASMSTLSIIHPSAIISKSAKIGAGVFISAGAVINADAIIGDGAIINTGAIVEHDCLIGDFAHLAPKATLGGAVSVGENTLIGIGASVKPCVKIASRAIVGTGSVVVRDLDEERIYKGNPAK
ncbi:MAG: acetyltransferase [Deltaproteobacteria bacterium]|nr:MAG: acetyltransferase [Deltaproteobacteria bacterium]